MRSVRSTLTRQIRKIVAELTADFETRNEQNSQWIWMTRKFANSTDWNHDRTLKFQQCNSNKSLNKSSDLTSSYDSRRRVTSHRNWKILSSDRKRNKIVTSQISTRYRNQISCWQILISNHKLSKYSSQLKSTCSQSTSSSLNHCRRQNKSTSDHNILIKQRPNVCKQKLSKCIARNIESAHDHENVFVISNLHWRHLSFDHFQLIASADRALFCSVSHRVFQILTRRRQKAKNFLFASLRSFTQHIDHAFFCSVFFHWVFQILTRHRQRTKNHLFYLFIDFDYHSIDRRRRREMS